MDTERTYFTSIRYAVCNADTVVPSETRRSVVGPAVVHESMYAGYLPTGQNNATLVLKNTSISGYS
jgi:hypothetical protein